MRPRSRQTTQFGRFLPEGAAGAGDRGRPKPPGLSIPGAAPAEEITWRRNTRQNPVRDGPQRVVIVGSAAHPHDFAILTAVVKQRLRIMVGTDHGQHGS